MAQQQQRNDILTLHSDTSSHSPLTLRNDVIHHLTNTPATTPGKQEVDKPWSFTKSLPTVLLYDDYGLEVYDKITGVKEYYPWSAEVEILKKDAEGIARRVFGKHGGKGQEREKEDEKKRNERPPNDSRLKDQAGQKWGDYEVGVNNQGVNGALGVTDKRNAQLASGYKDSSASTSPQNNSAGDTKSLNSMTQDSDRAGVLVELGAGSLKKTSLLLRAVAGLLRSQRQDVKPVLEVAGYYALDLEYKQLALTLDALVAQHGDVLTVPNAPNKALPADKIVARGLCASYDDFVPFLHSGLLSPSPSRKVVLWLGSSLGNFSRSGAAEFLRSFALGALDPAAGDSMLIGIDGCHYGPMVEAAYNDSEGVTRDFILNAIARTRDVLGLQKSEQTVDVEEVQGVSSLDWTEEAFEYADRWNAGLGRHEAYLRATRKVVLDIPPPSPALVAADANNGAARGSVRVEIEAGELIAIEKSYKYSLGDVADLFERARVRPVQRWVDRSFGSTYGLWAVERPGVWFEGLVEVEGRGRRVVDVVDELERRNGETEGEEGKKEVEMKEEVNRFGVPTADEWAGMWKLWDTVTLDMIPRDMLHEKPIDLRHIVLFYFGHIPTFLDIHLARYETLIADGKLNNCDWKKRLTEPASFADIFERGIDPNMDDPTQCHDHSIVPVELEDWPKLQEILDYTLRVRQRVRSLYTGDVVDPAKLTRKLARVLVMLFEHEALHLETLLYMLAQAEPGRILPAPGFSVPDWESLASGWDREVQRDGPVRRNAVVAFETTTIEIGHDDLEEEDLPVNGVWPKYNGESMGWDNESPKRSVEVGKFKVDLLPVSNAEYATFLKASGSSSDLVPASWIPATASKTNGVHQSNGANGVSDVSDNGVNGVNGHSSPSSSPSSSPTQSPVRGADAPYDVRVIAQPGRVSMRVAAHWPVQCSGAQLARYAAWKGGRVPTADELRCFYQSEHAAPLGSCGPGVNVGFRNWHPTPPTIPQTNRDGTMTGATNGGVWEWSSSDFAAHPGYVQSKVYPGYSSDFFDGHHSIVLGGSWATIPRIAARVNSMTNWYQTGYPYVFAGGRVAYDV